MIPLLPPVTMLPRLHEPELRAAVHRPVFLPGTPRRRLALVVDSARLPRGLELDLLYSLASHDLVDVVSTTADQPGGVMAIGPYDHDEDAFRPGRGDVAPIIRGASTWFTFAEEHARSRGTEPSETLRRFLLAAGARDRTDALVVDDLDFIHGVADSANPMSLRQALALIGLFLRSRGREETGCRDGITRRIPVAGQYHNVTRALLPSGWRWYSACVANADVTGDETTRWIADAVHQRFARCIRARDEVLAQSLLPSRVADWELRAYHLDALLLMLNGCFDAAKRVAIAACPPMKENLKEHLAKHAPALGQLVDDDQPTGVRSVMRLVAKLRNTIHAEPLAHVRNRDGDGDRLLVGLPPKVARAVREDIGRLGGETYWGLLPDIGSSVPDLLDPLPFVQLLVPYAANSLDMLMANTPVENLPGVTPDLLINGPPTGDGAFDPEQIRRLQLLTGLLLEPASNSTSKVAGREQ